MKGKGYPVFRGGDLALVSTGERRGQSGPLNYSRRGMARYGDRFETQLIKRKDEHLVRIPEKSSLKFSSRMGSL